MKNNILIILLVFLPVFAVAQSPSSTVLLKNGIRKEGRIIEIIPGEQLKMELESGETIVVSMDDVDKIVQESVKVPDYTSKGKFVISGATDLSSSIYKIETEYPDGEHSSRNVKTINFRPELGYFIADNILVSIFADLGYWNVSGSKLFSAMGGPSVKYFLGGTKFRPYLQGDLMIGWNLEKDKIYTSHYGYSDEYGYSYGYGGYEYDDDDYITFKVSQYGWALGAGGSVFLNESISLNIGIGYVYTRSSEADDYSNIIKTKGVEMDGGISFYL